MQHEGDTLGWCEGLQDDQQCQPDRVGKQRFLFGVDRALDCDRCDGSLLAALFIGSFQRLFTSRLARPQHVEADARHHGGEPAREVVDIIGTGTAQPKPGFLHCILGLGRRTKHAVSNAVEMLAIGLEAVTENFLLVHGHTFLCRSVKALTNETRPM